MTQHFLRFSESSWKISGRTWQNGVTIGGIRSTRSSTRSEKTYVSWTPSSSSSRKKRKRVREKSHAIGIEFPFCRFPKGFAWNRNSTTARKTLRTKRLSSGSSFTLKNSNWSLLENIEGKSEKERPAVSGTQQMVNFLPIEMAQEAASSASWKVEVVRLTKEVAEQRSKRRAESSFLYSSPFHQPPAWSDCSRPFTSTEKVDSPANASRPAGGNPWEHIPSVSTALSDTRSVADEDFSKRKDAEKIEFELWPHASEFNSWKVSFRREGISGSDWSALSEVGLAADWNELSCSGFTFDRHQIEFEFLDSKIAKKIMNITPRSTSWRKHNTRINIQCWRSASSIGRPCCGSWMKVLEGDERSPHGIGYGTRKERNRARAEACSAGMANAMVQVV